MYLTLYCVSFYLYWQFSSIQSVYSAVLGTFGPGPQVANQWPRVLSRQVEGLLRGPGHAVGPKPTSGLWAPRCEKMPSSLTTQQHVPSLTLHTRPCDDSLAPYMPKTWALYCMHLTPIHPCLSVFISYDNVRIHCSLCLLHTTAACIFVFISRGCGYQRPYQSETLLLHYRIVGIVVFFG